MVLKAWAYDQLKVFPVTFIFVGIIQEKSRNKCWLLMTTMGTLAAWWPLKCHCVSVMLMWCCWLWSALLDKRYFRFLSLSLWLQICTDRTLGQLMDYPTMVRFDICILFFKCKLIGVFYFYMYSLVSLLLFVHTKVYIFEGSAFPSGLCNILPFVSRFVWRCFLLFNC